MLKRFQRDAFGMVKFEMVAQGMVDAGQLSDEVRKRILKEARLLGLRVSSDEPRKTRIAAAFSLWMCVFRPVTFDTERLSELKPEKLETFCAALNFWLAYSYLEKFGWVSLGEGEDARIRLERIKHDFTFREVSTSTLETLYCSIFRLNRSCHCKSGTHVLEVLHHRETNVGFTIALNGEACHRFQSIEEVEACIYSKASWLPEGFIPPTKMEDWQSGRAGNS